MSESTSALETVMFTDVRSSTELRTTVGDDEAHRRLRAVQDAIVRSVEEHRGTVVKNLGDGILACFPSPRQAVYCAAEAQEAVQSLSFGENGDSVAVRIGINTGEVVREEDDLFGEAVNAAARIAALGDGGQTLVAGVVKDLAGTVRDVTFVDRGTHPLKGFPEEWRVFEVKPANRAVRLLDKTPFVGRKAELGQLERHLDEALRGRGSVVMIGGEPGVGKTRLADQLAEEARRRGAIVFGGACYEVETATPFAPFVEVLEATARTIPRDVFREIIGDSGPELARFYPELRVMFPDIPEPIEVPEEQERRYTFNSIGRYVARAAAVRPLMLILDDLHWADEATLQLLQHFAALVGDLSALIVGTYRDVELAVSRPLARTLEHMVRHQRAHRIALKRLSRDDVAVMLHRLAGSPAPPAFVDVIHSETNGNAFFVEEVFRHLLEDGRLLEASGEWRDDVSMHELDVPESVRLVVGRRIERLGRETRDVLTHAAVIGRMFHLNLLEASAGTESVSLIDALDEAERARLIDAVHQGPQARYQFVHELVRQTLLADISLPRRQKLHLDIADAIEKVIEDDGDERLPELAHHLYQAGAAAETSRTVKYLTAAADRAQATGGSEEALRTYERALSLVGRDPTGRGELLYKMARSLRGLQRWDEAMSAWTEALDIFEKTGDADRFARVCGAIADRYTWIGRWQAAIDVLDRGLSRQTEDGRARGGLLARQGSASAWLGDHATALDRIEEAERLADASDDQRTYWTARSARVIYHWCFNEHDRVIEVGVETANVLRQAGALWGLVTVLAFMQFSYVALGRWDEAEEVFDELRPLAEQLGHPSGTLFADRWHAALLFLRKPEARMQLDAATRDLEFTQAYDMPWVAESYAWLGNIELWFGNWEKAVELAERGVAESAPGAWEGSHRGMHLMLRSYLGDTSAGKEGLRDVTAREAGGIVTIGRAAETTLVAEALIVLGDVEGLATIHDHLDFAVRRQKWRSFSTMPTSVLLAASKAARGDFESAESLVEETIADAAAKRSAISEMIVRWLWGKTLASLGRVDAARPFLAEAAAGLEHWGYVRLADLARATAASPGPRADRGAAAADDLVFVREGEFWTIGATTAPVRLKDTTGLRYLAALLANAGREVKALELAGAASGGVGDAVVDEDSGELLDEQARATYRRRLTELETEIAEAVEWADDARVEKLRSEFDALVEELGRATGLGGRARRAGSTAERARVNVTKAIRAAIKRIAAADGALGEHLDASVRTGTTCMYLPDPADAPSWRLT